MNRFELGCGHVAGTSRRSPKARTNGNRGAGVLEFALVLPILLGFVLSVVDLGRYVLTTQRAASAAAAAAELASQTERFTPEMNVDAVATGQEVAVLAVAAREVALPVALLSDGTLFVTLVANDGGGPAISWQRRWGRSDAAPKAGPAALGGIALASGEAAVVAEVVCQFRPWLLSGRLFGLPETWEYRAVSVRRPRLGGPVIQS